jgi:uncharacterized damage-inducible protein DinB
VTNLDSFSQGAVSQVFIAQARALLATEYLPKIERCLERLSDEQVWWRANPESNSIGNLLLHLCGNARQWIVSGLGRMLDQRMRQAEFDERLIIPRSELLSRVKETLQEVDSVLADFDARNILERREIQGTNVTALEAIFHVVEHFSMHTGQVILLTKMLAKTDLEFYNFSSGVPEGNWCRPNRLLKKSNSSS